MPSRYASAGRDVALYLVGDFSYQGYLNAMLILNGMGAPVDTGNPYTQSKTMLGIATFGTSFHGLDLVTKVANAALRAVHYQKWLVHRRLRPEEFGGRVHNHMTKAAQYPIHATCCRHPRCCTRSIRSTAATCCPCPCRAGARNTHRTPRHTR